MLNKAHKIKLNPTNSQKAFFEKSFGVARFTYNWALNSWDNLYNSGQKCRCLRDSFILKSR